MDVVNKTILGETTTGQSFINCEFTVTLQPLLHFCTFENSILFLSPTTPTPPTHNGIVVHSQSAHTHTHVPISSMKPSVTSEMYASPMFSP